MHFIFFKNKIIQELLTIEELENQFKASLVSKQISDSNITALEIQIRDSSNQQQILLKRIEESEVVTTYGSDFYKCYLNFKQNEKENELHAKNELANQFKDTLEQKNGFFLKFNSLEQQLEDASNENELLNNRITNLKVEVLNV